MSSRLIALVGALALGTSTASANDKQKALELFDQGRALRDRGHHDEACKKFDASYELDPAPGTQLNIADCKERAGEIRDAYELFGAAAAEFDRTRDPDRARYARTRADALLPRLATVVLQIQAPPSGTRVKIGELELTAASELRVQLDPGDVEIRVTAPDRPPFSRRATLVAGATSTFLVPRPATAEPPATLPVEPELRRDRGRVKLAYGLAAAGGATLIATVTLSVIAKRRYDRAIEGPECTASPRVCTPAGLGEVESAQSLATVGTVLGVATGALALGAAVVYVTAPKERITQTALTPVVSGSTVGLTVSGRF